MKIHRFFINQKIQDTEKIEVTDSDLIHQLRNVLRMSEGNVTVLLDGTGLEFEGELIELSKKSAVFKRHEVRNVSKDDILKISLYPSVIKKDKLEYVLQKCTEIGVLEFRPVISERTEKLNFNMKRAEVIIKEAAEQSEKSYLPSVMSPTELVELDCEDETETFLYLDMDAPMIDIKSLVTQSGSTKGISIFIGPEGGWSEGDREWFDKKGVKPVSLGKTVLRAETASIAVSSLLLLGRE